MTTRLAPAVQLTRCDGPRGLEEAPTLSPVLPEAMNETGNTAPTLPPSRILPLPRVASSA